MSIIVIGDSGVGKSSLLDTLSKAASSDHNPFYFQPTIGNDMYRMRNSDIKMVDTPGSNTYFHYLSHIQQSKVILILYDTNNINSFLNIQHRINSILESLDLSNQILYIVGNKLDLEQKVEEKDVYEWMNKIKDKFKYVYQHKVSVKENVGCMIFYYEIIDLI